jgi:hypothetical protein
MGASAGQQVAWILFRFSRRRASDKRVFGEWAELASASQHANADSLLPGRYGRRLRGVSRGLPKNGRFRCRTAHSSDDLGRVGQASRAKAFGSREERSHVGVPGFALKRLQNLVSGVWLERRASVAAEASGRGLAFGG